MSATAPRPHVHALSCWCKPRRDLADRRRLLHCAEWSDDDGVFHRAEEVTISDEAEIPYYYEEIRA